MRNPSAPAVSSRSARTWMLALVAACTAAAFAPGARATARSTNDGPLVLRGGPLLAFAADDAPGADAAKADSEKDAGDETAAELPEDEVKVGGTVVGDSLGGATGFVFKQGFYTQSDLGGFLRFGGYTIAEDCGGLACKPVATSQTQPYIGLSAGYDLFQWLGVQLSFGTGFVSNAAPYQNQSPETPRDYGMTFVNIGVVGSYYFFDRLALAGKVFGGALFLTPEPDLNEPFYGGNVGAGVGIRYATLLPDTFIGADVNFHLAIAPTSGPDLLVIPALSFAPVIKYVF